MIKDIPLDQGLVTARSGVMLDEGELTVATDSRYRPDDPAIQRAWGRTKYLNADAQVGGGAGKIIGLAFCPFDAFEAADSDDFVVAHLGSSYYVSVFAARSGALSGTPISNVGAGTQLDALFADNRWYLFNGNQDGISNKVLGAGTTDPTSRNHGMLPVSQTPTSPTISTQVGEWPTDETFWGEGRYFFFTTEVLNQGEVDELESSITGEPPFVDLAKDSNGEILFDVLVQRHDPIVNTGADEVRVYMVKTSLYQSWDASLLARAFRVGTITVTGTASNDTLTLSGNYVGYGSSADPTTTALVSGTVTNHANLKAADDTAASWAASTAGVADVHGYSFALPASSPVLGFKIYVRARARGWGSRQVTVTPRYGAGPSTGTVKSFRVDSHDYKLYVVGGDTDTFGVQLTETEVNSSNFGVRISSGSFFGAMDVDYVRIQVFTSTVPSIGPAYPLVALQTGNVLTVHSANAPPPVSSTGDIIDGCLVVDDVSRQNGYAWSLPGQYDYFPEPYAGRVNGGKDKFMKIRKVGNVGLFFMEHSIHRLNFVPLTTDPEFIPGRALERIVPNHGCVSKQGVALFQLPGGATVAAYVSHNGVYMNDAQQDNLMTGDIKWETLVDVTKLSSAVLIDYPKEHVLVMFYADSTSAENNKYILIHYHQTHRKKNGNFKITGPCSMEGACAVVAKLGAENILLTGHATDAKIYVEDNGVSDTQASGSIDMLVETREIYPFGIGRRGTVKFLQTHQNGAGANMTVTVTPRYKNRGAALATGTGIDFNPDTEGFKLTHTHIGTVEGIRYRLSLPDAAGDNAQVAFDFLLHDVDDHGKATAGN